MADVQDLFREHLDAAGMRAEFMGAQEPVQVVKETIGVKGASAIALDVRITRHGPLISDAINANNAESARVPRPAPLEPIAFRWTALDPADTTIVSVLRVNDAHNWNDFTSALRTFVVPPQNFVYADVDGHIGYYAPGHFPIRDSGDGSMPAEGWSGRAEWGGWVPFDELPHAFDPPEHLIVSANEKIAPSSYPHAIGGEWIDPYRAQRIVNLLAGKRGLTATDFSRMQSDTVSLHAQAMLPLLLAHASAASEDDNRALTLLRRWNGDARGDSAAAAVFQAWYYELMPATVGDELGPVLTANYHDLDRSSYVARFLMHALQTPDSPWCDDVRTEPKETCNQTAMTALHAGLARLRRSLGSDMTKWRWDAVHHAVFAHTSLDTVPLLGWWLRREAPHGGDWSTVNVGPVFAPKPFEQHAVPGYRQVVDLSPKNDSRMLDAVGQSGHVLSPRYSDALRDWSTGQARAMRMDRAAAERNAIGTLRLTPASAAGSR
jgi:penicillin G amidase